MALLMTATVVGGAVLYFFTSFFANRIANAYLAPLAPSVLKLSASPTPLRIYLIALIRKVLSKICQSAFHLHNY